MNKQNLLFAFGAVALAAMFLLANKPSAETRELAHKTVAQGGLLLDVRTPAEFADGHVPNAVNIPVQELEKRLGELKPEQPVVVYCRSGHRSGIARGILEKAGFKQVVDLGPMTAW